MRVIDCNQCGETLRAADDSELVRRLTAHHRTEHDEKLDSDEAEEIVEGEAYEATDS